MPAAAFPLLYREPTAQRRSGSRCNIPDLYFLLSDGVCYHGHAVSGGKKTGSGPLGLKRELREVSGARGRKAAEGR